MPRAGATDARGYGRPHQRARRWLLDHLVVGALCAHCGQPMFKTQKLQADHSTPRALADGLPDRLLHASCNASRGASFGNRLRRVTPPRKARIPITWVSGQAP